MNRPPDIRGQLGLLESRAMGWIGRHGVLVMRLSLGVIFLWFGALKLFPGFSPAEGLAGRTIQQLSFGLVAPALGVPLLGVFETLLGLSLLTGYALRLTILALLAHMAGTAAPFLLLPEVTFTTDPLSLTLEGQYIIKNLVLISGALVVGTSIRPRKRPSATHPVLPWQKATRTNREQSYCGRP